MCQSGRNVLSQRILQEFKRRRGGDEIDREGKEGNGCCLSEGAPPASPPARLRRHLPRPRSAPPPPPPAGVTGPEGPAGAGTDPRRSGPGGRGGARGEEGALGGGGARRTGGGRGGLGPGLRCWRSAARAGRAGSASSGRRDPPGRELPPAAGAPRLWHGNAAGAAGVPRGAGAASGRGVAVPARFLSLSLPLVPPAALARGRDPDPLLRAAPRDARSLPVLRRMDKSAALFFSGRVGARCC